MVKESGGKEQTNPRAPRPGHKALPWGLLGALALVVLIEQGVLRHEIDLLNPWQWDWRFSATASTGPAARAGVLCFGDSLMLNGLVPTGVEQACGKSTYNLAVTGGSPASSYYLLRRALRAGARPAAVLLGYSPTTLRAELRSGYLLRQWPELLSVAEMADLAWWARDADLFGALLAARVLPTLRDRAEIRPRVVEALDPSSQSQRVRFLMAQICRNRRVNRGALVLPPEATHKASGPLPAGFLDMFRVNPLAAAYLDRLLALASEHRVQVVWVIPPVASEVQAACDQSGIESQRTSFLHGLQRKHSGLIVFDGRGSGYAQELYSKDPVHLNETGASVFSAAVGESLRASLAGTGCAWTKLPAYRPRTTPDVENFDESAMALARAGSAPGAATSRR